MCGTLVQNPESGAGTKTHGVLNAMSSGKSDLIEIACEVRRETDKAFLIFDGAKEVWLPKALVEFGDCEATMPEWLALDKGLI